MPGMAWDRIRQFLFGGSQAEPAPTVEPSGQQQIDMIAATGQRMADVVNECMRIAHDSKNIETRRSRVHMARERMAQLLELAADYPFIKIGRLTDVERDLARIDRVTDALSNHHDAMTAANSARLETFRKNMKFCKGVRWLGTLDSHTCIACAALDGSQWDFDGKPIGDHRFAFCAPPMHDNCRCTITGVLKGGLDEIFGKTGLDAKNAATTRASEFGATDARTFADFLKRQDAEFVEEVLGKRRAEMYLNGRARMQDFINSDARVLSIDELRHRLRLD